MMSGLIVLLPVRMSPGASARADGRALVQWTSAGIGRVAPVQSRRYEYLLFVLPIEINLWSIIPLRVSLVKIPHKPLPIITG